MTEDNPDEDRISENGARRFGEALKRNSSLKPIDLGDKTSAGDTPLHHAARAGNEEIIKALLKQGADPRLRSDNLSALDLARNRGVSNATIGVMQKKAEELNAAEKNP